MTDEDFTDDDDLEPEQIKSILVAIWDSTPDTQAQEIIKQFKEELKC